MALLPQFQGGDTPFQLLQNSWAAQLNPLLKSQLGQGYILKNISLVSGDNVINHKLGRKLVGWMAVRQRGPASIYDTQDSNQMPQLTLTLNSSAQVSIDLYVF